MILNINVLRVCIVGANGLWTLKLKEVYHGKLERNLV